ncbi:AI-2E family transporter [Nitrospira sp. Nam74]
MLTEEHMRESPLVSGPTAQPGKPPDVETRGFDAGRVAIVGVFVLACFFALHAARMVFMPIILALLFGLLLAPVIRFLKQYHVPEPLGAALVLVAVGSVVGYGVYRLSEPAAEWFAKAPGAFRQIEYKIGALKKPMEEMGRATALVEKMATLNGPTKQQEIEVKQHTLSDTIFNQTGEFVTGTIMTMMLLYFLLASGDLFLQKLVKILPRFHDKKRAVEIVREMEQQVSAYLFTVTLINIGVGFAVGVAMYALGMPNPMLWGVMACLLTYVPYLGPAIGVITVALVATLSFDNIGWVLLIAGTYWGITIIEGTFVTPQILGHRLTLNPFVILAGLMFWGWLWGIPGTLLAVPLIASMKIFSDHIEPLAPLGEFLGR